MGWEPIARYSRLRQVSMKSWEFLLTPNRHMLKNIEAALRHELGDSHTYDYAEGTIPYPMDSDVAQYFPSEGECYAYFDPEQPSTFTAAMDNLELFIEQEGPFDAILGYSHGAQLAASMLARANTTRSVSSQSIKCAVFISGGIPYTADPRWWSHDATNSTTIKLRHVDPRTTGAILNLPTTNVWGKNDNRYPGTSEVLSELCKPEWRVICVHAGGHEIPGGSARQSLFDMVTAIRKTLDRALAQQ